MRLCELTVGGSDLWQMNGGGTPAMGGTLLNRPEVIAVSAASAVCEELTATGCLVEVETGNVSGANAFVFHLRTSVCKGNIL